MSDDIKKKVYGIDLGTTYSAISHVGETGNAEIINNPDGGAITRSAVFFEDGGVVVGDGAKESAYTDPDNFVHLIKREMGTPWRKEFLGNEHTPESISALILKYMVKGAEMSGHDVKDVVITCPAYFNEAERQATKIAGVLAGLNVLAVLDEPIAAAISYGMGVANSDTDEAQKTKQIIVYDLGGASFDVTVVQISPEGFKVICSDGDHKLGGADWDNALRDLLLDKLYIENPDADDIMANPETRAALITTVEQTKMRLSQRETASARITCCDGGKCKVSVTRSEFDEATKPYLNRTAEFTDAMIAMARMKTGIGKIDEFLLVGGSTLMPQVMEMVNARYKDALGVEPKLYEPNFAVSNGAALYGNNKAIKTTSQKTDSSPALKRSYATSNYGIKLETSMGDPYCYNLLKKGTMLPCASRTLVLASSGNESNALSCNIYSNQVLNDTLVPLLVCKKEKEIHVSLNENLAKLAKVNLRMELDETENLHVHLADEDGVLDINM